MPSLQSIADKYPLISLASPQNQVELFSVLSKTSLQSSAIQVGFDRKPDFFELIRSQGSNYFVFLMHNEDRSVQGFGVFSFREMLYQKQRLVLGYTSDLRTTPQLSRAARVQWRKMYTEIVSQLHHIDEFGGASHLFTAVWDNNTVAQKALVKKNKNLSVSYVPIASYQVATVVGRWRFKNNAEIKIRQLGADEHHLLEQFICKTSEKNEITWTTIELARTLKQLNKKPEDFLVIYKNSAVQAICLLCEQIPGRTTKILALPRRLTLLAYIVKLLTGRHIQIGHELKMKYLLFFRSLNHNETSSHLADFLHYSMNVEKQKPAAEQVLAHVVATWNDSTLSTVLLKKGFINSNLSAQIYQLSTIEANNMKQMNFRQLEIGLL